MFHGLVFFIFSFFFFLQTQLQALEVEVDRVAKERNEEKERKGGGAGGSERSEGAGGSEEEFEEEAPLVFLKVVGIRDPEVDGPLRDELTLDGCHTNGKIISFIEKAMLSSRRKVEEEEVVTYTEGEMKEEVVVEVEGETKETTTVASQQQEEEEDVCPVCIEPLQKDVKKFNRYMRKGNSQMVF